MAETREEGGTVWDAPNQQVVRPDSSAPWDEGDGGESGTPVEEPQPEPQQEELPQAQPYEEQDELDEMTKDELLAKAQDLGVVPANAAMTKAELADGIRRHNADRGVRDA